jgi:hypothetical protein
MLRSFVKLTKSTLDSYKVTQYRSGKACLGVNDESSCLFNVEVVRSQVGVCAQGSATIQAHKLVGALQPDRHIS